MQSVLLIDDCPVTVQTRSALLRLEGFHVDSAADGAAGVALALAGQFDVILLDLCLPDMSGVEVARTLRARGLSVPILILTVFPTTDSAFDSGSVGVSGYIDSPLFGDDLIGVVHQALNSVFPVRAAGSMTEVKLKAIRPLADTRVAQVTTLIETRPEVPWSAQELAEKVQLSESRLRHRFAAVMGVSLYRYISHCRLERIAHLLRTTSDSFKSIASSVGLRSDLRHVRRAFRKRFGASPKLYRAMLKPRVNSSQKDPQRSQY